MGDRTNPIKFGPEWLRNLSCEPSSPGGTVREGSSTGNPRPPSPGASGSQQPHRPTNNPMTNTSNPPKVLLAKLRYGREEMLALFDRQTADAPGQLKSIDILYQPRGKSPYALNNTFEDDTRDTMRGQSSIGGLSSGDRYPNAGRTRLPTTLGTAESRGRALSATDNRGRAKGYNRQSSVGRTTPNWHGNPRNSYSGMPDDDPNQPPRPWNNNSQPASGLRPTNLEQPDWQNKQQQYRTKRQPSSNWRQQPNRDEGEEWRSQDGGRRPQEKWEWDWQEGRSRPSQENKSWHSNRRTWVGGENNEDSLPEWAVDNAEACGGTFDSSGAFHGYSNDDSNLPKNQESSYPLARSHTHGNFARSKTAEEGSEEWWASEKAKKLSPKRFDASEIKFKKPPGDAADEKSNPSTARGFTSDANGQNTGAIPKNKYLGAGSDRASKNFKSRSKENDDNSSEKQAAGGVSAETVDNKAMEETTKVKTFDTRTDGGEKQNEEKGNFQSVILTQNNSLRQKHQNIVVSPTETPKRQPTSQQQNMMQFFDNSNQARQHESNDEKMKEKVNSKLVEDILQMSLDDGIPSATMAQLLTNHSNSAVTSGPQLSNTAMQMRMGSPLNDLGINAQNKHIMQPLTDMQPTRLQSSMMQPIGITNSMLNASLGLPMPNSGLPLQGMPPSLGSSVLSNPSMLSSNLQGMAGRNMQSSGLQSGGIQSSSLQSGQSNLQGITMPGLQGNGMQVGGLQGNMPVGMMNSGMQSGGNGLPGFQSTNNSMPGMSNNSSLFNNMQNTNDISNRGNQNMFPMHGLQHSQSQTFNNSFFANMLNQPLPPLPNMGMHNSIDQWYYEDPNKTIQGPFTSKEMYTWFRAGFFSPTLMVRRACDAVMRPLGTYGHMPFGQMDMMPSYPLGGGFDLQPPQIRDSMMNSQPNLGIDVESLWGQPLNNAPTPDQMWMQAMNNNSRNENHINNLPMYFWENQPSAMPAAPLLPEDMKTEDEILAQMRAAQAEKPASPLSFLEPSVTSPESSFSANPALDMEQLQKLIQNDDAPAADVNNTEQPKQETTAKEDPTTADTAASKPQNKVIEAKPSKETIKLDNNGKPVKSKDAATKQKSKNKGKDEKRDESVENKAKEGEVKAKARSAETSPTKNKKEDKVNKKELEKEKKEWIKEGFTIVKSAEKSKDSKKKAEEAKAAEEADRKKKEEEKLLAEEKKRQLETTKKQQEVQGLQQAPTQRQPAESVSKKAPWSASSQGLQATSRDGPTLAEIQRLEREKKLEQMKEQQQMMQLIAQQQAAALAREQEMQAGLGWAKKKPAVSAPSQTLAEIQIEARKQAALNAAAAASAVAAAAREEALATPPLVNSVPWGNTHNGGGAGFWDSPPAELAKPAPKPVEVSKPAEPKPKKKVTVMAPPKKENTPSVEFDMWCNNMLVSWRDTGIDIPTFVCFLKDIESPYEVKDYVKCYLGDSREAGDFARQFLERRSRILRVGMVTPSDDLCSPAVAINPRTNSGSDYTEVKGKGKKTKKNKMLKVDARNILGFSVTASEDRINVGDIDTV